ncbi:hypothetical protein HPB49_026500 [Dermacentor silvarum]|nr:hypothetical protein HPB49_026500 [Dermacentor silvarum]
MGWAPTRTLKEIVWGLNALFTDLLNFDDPLDNEAAEHYQRDKEGFKAKVREYVLNYAKRAPRPEHGDCVPRQASLQEKPACRDESGHQARLAQAGVSGGREGDASGTGGAGINPRGRVERPLRPHGGTPE